MRRSLPVATLMSPKVKIEKWKWLLARFHWLFLITPLRSFLPEPWAFSSVNLEALPPNGNMAQSGIIAMEYCHLPVGLLMPLNEEEEKSRCIGPGARYWLQQKLFCESKDSIRNPLNRLESFLVLPCWKCCLMESVLFKWKIRPLRTHTKNKGRFTMPYFFFLLALFRPLKPPMH